MQPSRRHTFLLGKLHHSQAATAVASQDFGNLCKGKLFVTAVSVFHPDSLSTSAGLNRMHPSYRLRSFLLMASGGNAGLSRSNAARNRDASTTSPFVSRCNVPVE